MAQSPGKPESRWIRNVQKTAQDASKTPLPWQRGQRRSALRVRLLSPSPTPQRIAAE